MQDGERFDDRHNWCDYGYDVDCGSRPCDDVAHCSTRPPTTTPEPDCTPPEQEIDCTGLKGYVPDPYNCRRYWQCDPGLPKIHFLCPDDEAVFIESIINFHIIPLFCGSHYHGWLYSF